MQKETANTWYSSWFDTPYYHILYKDRNIVEAEGFMQRLTTFLQLKEGNTILDLACGKGRHSLSLSKMGFDVTGVDLSEKSIKHAKQFETSTLHFKVHDMCFPYPKKFDAVFNLFTSFGYFEDELDNIRTIRAIKEELKATGHAVIDFMNVNYVMNNLVPSETKTIQGITFIIERYVENKHIVKTISFTHDNKPYHFVERVKAITLEDFESYFKSVGLTLRHCFGSYNLDPFDKSTSDRLILIFN